MKFINIKIENLNSINKEIENVIERNKGLIFHEIEFNKIASKHFKTKLTYKICMNKNNQLIAFCPIHGLKKGFLTFQYTKAIYDTPFGGWVYNNKDVQIDLLIKNFLNESVLHSLYYVSNIQFPGNETNYFPLNSTKKTLMIDLSYKEDHIWENYLSSKKRNKVRKAIKSGIKIKHCGIDGLDQFFPIIDTLHKQLGYNVLSKEYYKEIMEYFYPKKKAVILLAELNDKIISGVFLVGNNNVIHYWKGASLNGVTNLGQGELLQWESIKWAKNCGSFYYDMCVVDEKKLPKIAEFKFGFSKDIMEFYTFTKKSYIFKIINQVQKCILKD